MLNPINKILKFTALSATLAGLLAACGGGPDSASSPNTQAFFPAAEEEWRMVFSDEFDGDSLDLSKWDIQTGDGSEFGLERWGNNEQQWYTEDSLTLVDGNLVITAAETPADAEDIPEGFPYTSGRIRTAEKFDFTYGRVEARVQAAPGQGLWTAAWMLPTDSPYTSWAAIGEVDITEVVNADTDNERVFQTLHYGFPWPLNQQTGLDIDDIDDPSGEYHIYAVEWSDREIRWYIDDFHYLTVPVDSWYTYYYADRETGYQAGAGAAPFDVDFHILLNLAVGGNLPGEVDPGAIPSDMIVDYVRVYECSYDEPGGIGCNSNANRNLDTPDDREAFEDDFAIYTDGPDALEWQIGGETVSRQLALDSFWNNDGALSFSEVPADEADRGTVIEVMTSNSGNISIFAEDGEPTELFGMGNNPNFWELHAGELKFDIKVMSAGTDADSSLMIKMDSGFPALGFYDLAVDSLPSDAWTTVSVPINDLLANQGEAPLDTSSIISFFVFEPTGAAHVQLDNIEIACGHPSNNGCGIRPPGGEAGGEVLEVYIDSVASIWTNGIGAWDTTFGMDYFEGDTNNLVTWSEVADSDPERGQIVSVSFGTNGANGVWYIQSAAGVDLSSFSDGDLIFDMKLEAGSTHGMTYKVDCFFPCSSGDQELDLSETVRGEWTTYEIPVSTLVAGGLDLSTVNTGIVIFPTWDDQQGVRFELDNIRWENPTTGGPGEPPSGEPNVAGTWEVASEAAALKVGPEPGDGTWWSNTDQDVIDRDCFFDDQYEFQVDGTYLIELQDETWLEPWQTGAAEACGTPIFPHDGMGDYTWEWDEDAGTLQVNGVGSYIGLPKAVNGQELSNPADAPSSVLYNIEFVDPATLTVSIEAGAGVWWTYKLVKVAEPPAPAFPVGDWVVANEPAGLKVGPEPGDGTWWSNTEQDLIDRACYFDDQYIIAADGTFDNVLQDETWLEGWQTGEADACGPPIFPHDGMGDYTWEYDEGAGTLTISGLGGYIGLPKAVNGSELANPADTPTSVVYNVVAEDDGSMTVSIEAGAGVWWTYKLVRL